MDLPSLHIWSGQTRWLYPSPVGLPLPHHHRLPQVLFAYLLKTNICVLYTRSCSHVGGRKGQAGQESRGSLRGQGGSSGPSPSQQAQLLLSCHSTRAEAATFMASHGSLTSSQQQSEGGP